MQLWNGQPEVVASPLQGAAAEISSALEAKLQSSSA
jgi:hypothetical protein